MAGAARRLGSGRLRGRQARRAAAAAWCLSSTPRAHRPPPWPRELLFGSRRAVAAVQRRRSGGWPDPPAPFSQWSGVLARYVVGRPMFARSPRERALCEINHPGVCRGAERWGANFVECGIMRWRARLRGRSIRCRSAEQQRGVLESRPAKRERAVRVLAWTTPTSRRRRCSALARRPRKTEKKNCQKWIHELRKSSANREPSKPYSRCRTGRRYAATPPAERRIAVRPPAGVGATGLPRSAYRPQALPDSRGAKGVCVWTMLSLSLHTVAS